MTYEDFNNYEHLADQVFRTSALAGIASWHMVQFSKGHGNSITMSCSNDYDETLLERPWRKVGAPANLARTIPAYTTV